MVFSNIYIFKCIKRSFASDSVNPCAVCAICPGNYLCMVITIATSQVDNVMQITAAPGVEDVNTSKYSHPWSSTFCSDSPFSSPIHIVFKSPFLTMIRKEKKTPCYVSQLVFTQREGEGGPSMFLSWIILYAQSKFHSVCRI